MTPAEFKAARRALGLSQNALAVALRVESGRTVRRWEAGERDIPGPAQVAIGYMLILKPHCCEQCRFWERGGAAEPGWGYCDRAEYLDGEAIDPGSAAVAKDSAGDCAYLKTRHNHCCRMWQPPDLRNEKKAPRRGP